MKSFFLLITSIAVILSIMYIDPIKSLVLAIILTGAIHQGLNGLIILGIDPMAKNDAICMLSISAICIGIAGFVALYWR